MIKIKISYWKLLYTHEDDFLVETAAGNKQKENWKTMCYQIYTEYAFI